jgi:hypothetical protein
MPFQSGPVSFCRLLVEGDAPQTLDTTTLATLAEYSFRETTVGAPDEVEAGWTTGEHLFDTQFTYEKNGFGVGGVSVLFALRIDTHRVPSEVKYAYKRMNEQASAEGNPSGKSSKSQRRDAVELAERQIHEDVAAGKFRKSKTVPLFWHLPSRTLFVGNGSPKVIELVAARFKESFNVDLTLQTSGSTAAHLLRKAGRERDFQELRPLAYTRAPHASADQIAAATAASGGGADEDGPRDMSSPLVPWVATAGDMKDFLGNEFLIWLWWQLETQEGLIQAPMAGATAELALMLDKSLDMECAWGVTGKQSLRGTGPTRLAEAGDALAGGKWPRKAAMLLGDGESQWELTLQADRWAFSGVKLPEVAEAQSMRDLTDARLELIVKLGETLDALFAVFLKIRAGSGWSGKRTSVRHWITKRLTRGAE